MIHTLTLIKGDRTLFSALILTLLLPLLTACPAPRPPTQSTTAQPVATDVRWRLDTAQRQSSYLRLDLPVIIAGTKITIFSPQSPGGPDTAAWAAHWTFGQQGGAGLQAAGDLSLYSLHLERGAVDGPMVDQLTGQPRAPADGGSYLVPLPGHPAASPPAASQPSAPADGMTFDVPDPMPLYLRLTVPAALTPGEYRFLIQITPPAGGGGAEAQAAYLAVHVADLAIPTEPRVLAVATTTTETLCHLYPSTFGAINAVFLDRRNPEHKDAITQLDALVSAARREGLALFVEDISPIVRIDDVGRLAVDWDAYDRVMQPYMDGSAFPDRLPLPVWLAPIPPRRISLSGPQLSQYIDACARHFADRGWGGAAAASAFLHPALVEGSGSTSAALRATISHEFELHMPRDMLAVTTPGIIIPQPRLWAVDDQDPRLPPVGALADENSVRVWPWMCVARTASRGESASQAVRGFVWREALAGVGDLNPDLHDLTPLLILPDPAHSDTVLPTLRAVWLNAGLNDAALLGLLEKRSDPTLLRDVLGAVVGRTGLTAHPRSITSRPADQQGYMWADLPHAGSGYLYAGWPTDRALWTQLPSMLQRLILANDPGKRATIPGDDPLYLAAQIWLARARRPVARVAGFQFGLRPGISGDIIDARVDVSLDNPVDVESQLDLRFLQPPPGDFDLLPESGQRPAAGARRGGAGGPGSENAPRAAQLPPSAVAEIRLPLSGHVDSLLAVPQSVPLAIRENHAGATLRLPVNLAIYRMQATDNPPKPDGKAEDWPDDPHTRAFGTMPVGIRYLSRPDMVEGRLRAAESPATIRWTFDDNCIYLQARCPQPLVSDERNTVWPLQYGRWWGSDVLQVQIADLGFFGDPAAAARGPWNTGRLVQIAFKPAGVAMLKTATRIGEGAVQWTDGPPPGAGALQYGITLDKNQGQTLGYTVQAAIPRAWLSGSLPGIRETAWRVNVLRHRASDLTSMSWSGPVVDDSDIGMMGLLVGTAPQP